MNGPESSLPPDRHAVRPKLFCVGKEELLHMFREKIKIRPALKILTPGTLPPQIRFIEDKRNWD